MRSFGVSQGTWLATMSLALLCSLTGCARPQPSLTLATTTSVANSGLLDVIAGAYQKETGVSVRSHLVGSGRALAMLASREVDVAITHAPDAEAATLRARPAWRYLKIMFNDFVLAGPDADPAGVRHSRSAVEAMQRIAKAGARFISRGDSSGTHEREQALWVAAGMMPQESRLVVAGAGMGATLRIAAEMDAYTLTDRATLMQQGAKIAILFDRDPVLINTYAVSFDGARSSAGEAERFAWWLSDGAGRDAIEQFRVGARRVVAFMPWPRDRPRSRPTDLP